MTVGIDEGAMQIHWTHRHSGAHLAAWLLLGLAVAGCNSVVNQDPMIARQDEAVAATDPALLKSFQLQMLQAVDQKKVYPKDAIMRGQHGVVVVSFDYVDGNKATNIKIWKSVSKALDKAAAQAVADADLPTKPPGFEHITKFSVGVNFAFSNSPSPPPMPAPLTGPTAHRSR